MEEEAAELKASLEASGLGRRGGLVDKEGFPIADTELLVAVREKRHRLAVLETDLREMNARIEAGVKEVFAKKQ